MNNNSTPYVLGELFIDATREVIEKGRIKAQMTRLERIITADMLQIKKIYAEIGKMYVDNTLKKNGARLEYLYKSLDHLKIRIERAQARVDMLKAAHSVDECTEAFRAELSTKIKSAQEAAASLKETAKNIKVNAYSAIERIKEQANSTDDSNSNIFEKINKLLRSLANHETQVDSLIYKLEDEFSEDDMDLQELIKELEEEEDSTNEIQNKLYSILKELDESDTEDSDNTEADTAKNDYAETDDADTSAQDSESAEKFDF